MTTFHGAEDAANAAIHDLKARIHSPHEAAGKTNELAQPHTDHDVHAAKPALKDTGREGKRAASLKHVLPQEDEEEGWMSDRSNGEPSVSVDRKRSKSPKHKPIKPMSGKHRLSIRRGVLGSRPVHAPRLPSDDAGAPLTMTDSPDGSVRGRTAYFESPYPSTRRSLRHDRIDTLRSSASQARSPRELSPARSVHFADGSSPRSPSTPGTPLPGSEAPSGDEREQDDSEDSPRSQVRFSLPNSGVGGRR